MKVGDFVSCQRKFSEPPAKGIVVGFNEKGEGGKEFVHVLTEGRVIVFMHFNVEVLSESYSKNNR